jgi:SAM-dependent methyltransferase
MEQHVFDEFSDVEDWHWWFRARREVIWALLRESGLPPQPSILDAGCGPGRNLIEYGALGPAVGVDHSQQALDACERRGLRDVVCGRLEALPFADASFDLVLACDVIEHIDDDVGVLSELRRVCAAHGQLVVTVPAHRWLWSRHDERLHHRRRYVRSGLEARAREAGWRLRRATYYNASLLPAIALARIAQRVWPPSEAHSDYATGRALNDVFSRMMAAEARVIARGVDLPMGVSLAMLCDRGAQPPRSAS